MFKRTKQLNAAVQIDIFNEVYQREAIFKSESPFDNFAATEQKCFGNLIELEKNHTRVHTTLPYKNVRSQVTTKICCQNTKGSRFDRRMHTFFTEKTKIYLNCLFVWAFFTSFHPFRPCHPFHPFLRKEWLILLWEYRWLLLQQWLAEMLRQMHR